MRTASVYSSVEKGVNDIFKCLRRWPQKEVAKIVQCGDKIEQRSSAVVASFLRDVMRNVQQRHWNSLGRY